MLVKNEIKQNYKLTLKKEIKFYGENGGKRVEKRL